MCLISQEERLKGLIQMQFKPVKKDGRFYVHEFEEKDIGTWYSSAERGKYLIPDIIVDVVESGAYTDSYYECLIRLFNTHRSVFKSYMDIRDIILIDDYDYIYEEIERIEGWFNNPDKFILPENCFIGFNEDYGDFGLWPVYDDQE